MLFVQRMVLVTVFTAGLSIMGVANAQHCASCSGAPALAAPVSGFSSGGFVDGGGFGYATGGCESGHCGGGCAGGGCLAGGGHGDVRAQFQQLRAQSEKIRARNAAWPKPFACADRQAFYGVFARQQQAGYVQCSTLVDYHFNLETGELNPLGQAVVQGLMKNGTPEYRQLYIYNGQSELDVQTKMQAVNSVVEQWYGGSVQVAQTDVWPYVGNGLRRETTNTLAAEITPPPQIEIPTGTGNTSDISVGN